MGLLLRALVMAALHLGNSSQSLLLTVLLSVLKSVSARWPLALPFGEGAAVLPASPSLHKLRG